MPSSFFDRVKEMFKPGPLQPTKVSADFSICAQLSEEHIAQAKQLGFASIICNRPDNEESGQLNYAEMAQLAEKQGLKAAMVPVSQGSDPHSIGSAMARALDDLPAPVLAYCRSGNRSNIAFNAAKPYRK